VENLSSRLTFFNKFVFPTVWIGGFAFGTLLMFVGPNVNQDIREARWILLLATIVGATLLYWACMRVKLVSLAEHEFIISNYRHTIRVPLRDVERASSSFSCTRNSSGSTSVGQQSSEPVSCSCQSNGSSVATRPTPWPSA
jgi:hypothetical protein